MLRACPISASAGRMGLWASSSTYSHKNHERLLHAWRILVDRNHPLQLVCTGTRYL